MEIAEALENIVKAANCLNEDEIICRRTLCEHCQHYAKRPDYVSALTVAAKVLRQKVAAGNNGPLTLEDLREMVKRCEGVYVANLDGRPLFREQRYCAAVLDVAPTYGGPAHIQAIYGDRLSLWEDDYGKTWVAYRHPPMEVKK